MGAELEYVAVGGNRQPAAADWNSVGGVLAYGADRNLALWKPLNEDGLGVYGLLSGHSDSINAIRFLPQPLGSRQIILTGASDKSIRIWREQTAFTESFTCESVIEDHEGSINCLATSLGTTQFVSGAADGTINIWGLDLSSGTIVCSLQQSIRTSPKFFPLALAFQQVGRHGAFVLLAGGTRSFIQVFVSDNHADQTFNLKATLTGHEGWIRSLDVISEGDGPDSDLLVASASQDKYIRLWRIHQGKDVPSRNTTYEKLLLNSIERSLSSKAHSIKAHSLDCTVTFEALLLGHEDWVYTATWDKHLGHLRLLSSSADSSLSLWEPEETSGVWVCTTRLGEISVQKGSTTATGSAGGYWIGLWVHNGYSVASLGRTGSWRIWSLHGEADRWLPTTGISGHINAVQGIAWAKDGSYLLSTSSDQTTRLHAEWKRGEKRSWHEFARPQIHGYDLNCVDTVSSTQFVSGADEKLLRVFDQPRGTAELLNALSGTLLPESEDFPEAASIPVLGLSNKTVVLSKELKQPEEIDEIWSEPIATISKSSAVAERHLPLEDDLARLTLWPEREKLYGHGYEVSAVAASYNGRMIATACKATSIDHAVVRLYETKTWREIRPVLKAHTLTVTCLRFSNDDKFILSVGRDRQWAVFCRDATNTQVYHAYASNPKGHSRMILGAAWAPSTVLTAFATAGRDKSIKVWAKDGNNFMCKTTITLESPVTTIDFLPEIISDCLFLAAGTETGRVFFFSIGGAGTDSFDLLRRVELGSE